MDNSTPDTVLVPRTPLEVLKNLLMEEDNSCRFLSDKLLNSIIAKYPNDFGSACYEALMRKANSDDISLPDGTRLASNRFYWLTLASLYKPNNSKVLNRSDEIKNPNQFRL